MVYLGEKSLLTEYLAEQRMELADMRFGRQTAAAVALALNLFADRSLDKLNILWVESERLTVLPHLHPSYRN
jgi:hypothetical protein